MPNVSSETTFSSHFSCICFPAVDSSDQSFKLYNGVKGSLKTCVILCFNAPGKSCDDVSTVRIL